MVKHNLNLEAECYKGYIAPVSAAGIPAHETIDFELNADPRPSFENKAYLIHRNGADLYEIDLLYQK